MQKPLPTQNQVPSTRHRILRKPQAFQHFPSKILIQNFQEKVDEKKNCNPYRYLQESLTKEKSN
jgi:hypothetical protein